MTADEVIEVLLIVNGSHYFAQTSRLVALFGAIILKRANGHAIEEQ